MRQSFALAHLAKAYAEIRFQSKLRVCCLRCADLLETEAGEGGALILLFFFLSLSSLRYRCLDENRRGGEICKINNV